MKRIYVFIILCCSLTLISYAQENTTKTGFFSDVKGNMEYTKGQIVSLANAVPEDKFTWRPAEGVRSISEVYMHIAGGNYFLASQIGMTMPDNFKQGMEESVTKKDEVIKWMNDSFTAVNDFLSKLDENILDEKIKLFGMDMTKRQVIFIMMNHWHEHLGQSVAYARVNSIVPPWSMASSED